MPFFQISDIEPFEILPGLRIRAPFGQNLMLSYLEFDRDAVVPFHSHPHEQVVYVIQGHLKITCGQTTFDARAGDSFLVRGGVQHGACAVEESAVVDIFTPCREDYVE